MTIDESPDLPHFVVRQTGTTYDVGPYVIWAALTVQGRSHVKHGYLGNVMRAGRLGYPCVANKAMFSTVLPHDVKDGE